MSELVQGMVCPLCARMGQRPHHEACPRVVASRIQDDNYVAGYHHGYEAAKHLVGEACGHMRRNVAELLDNAEAFGLDAATLDTVREAARRLDLL